MNCDDALRLIGPHADGELSLPDAQAIEKHMRACPACAAEYREVRGLGDTLRERLREPAPPGLAARVRASLHDVAEASAPRPRRVAAPWLRFGGPAFALGVAFAWAILSFVPGPLSDDPLSRRLIDAHVRSLMAEHLTDVASSDRHTVKPWFNGRLDFSPPVRDYTADGFPLLGGRLDYVGRRPVAAIVYRHRRHSINLFVQPGDGEQRETHAQGYNIVTWADAGLSYAAVSDLNRADMRRFVALVRGGGSPPDGGQLGTP